MAGIRSCNELLGLVGSDWSQLENLGYGHADVADPTGGLAVAASQNGSGVPGVCRPRVGTGL